MSCSIDLSGRWSLNSPALNGQTIPVDLPGDNYTALLNAGVIPDPYFGKNELPVQEYRNHPWEFTRSFEVTEELLRKNFIYLNAEMVDLFCTISINGKRAASTSNMFAIYRPEVKALLKVGTNTITLRFRPVEPEGKKIEAELPMHYPMCGCSLVPYMNLVRKPHCHGGWDWGVTLMVSGVYEPLTLIGIDNARIDYLYADQKHEKNTVQLTAITELYAEKPGKTEIVFEFNGESRTVNTNLKTGYNTVKTTFEVKNPRLWWPNGYGSPELYRLTVRTGDQCFSREIGLRTLEIVNQPDEFGISLLFRVNGVDVFAKGADWIPADGFPARQTPAVYEDLLESSRLANMNMIRVWGGGQYEKELFYELCDRKGLMVWQDMMFACSIYPSSEKFIESVKLELEYQIRRLRSHACLAIWCGDNEVIGATNWHGPAKRPALLVNYDRLNRELERMVRKYDPDRVFWPSSPCGGPGNFNDGWHDDSCGDMHYWEVWHGGKTFDAYYSVKPRFCSEFGYQSFPSLETVKTFCPEEQFNVFSPVMDHHQKCNKGNAPIIGMFGKYFRMPESFADFLYLSQVQQALAIKTGVEYWRSLRPRCMGTLFWQLNDNWPVASWASIEYGGKWKQLQYHARRFYAPVISLIYKDTEGETRLFCVSDLKEKTQVTVEVTVRDFDGRELSRQTLSTSLKAGESKVLKNFKQSELAQWSADNSFLEISTNAQSFSGKEFRHQNSYFLAPFKSLNLQPAHIKTSVSESDGKFFVELSTDKPAFFVTLDTPGIPGIFSDNSLTLLPESPLRLEFSPKQKTDVKHLEKSLEINHLRKTYR